MILNNSAMLRGGPSLAEEMEFSGAYHCTHRRAVTHRDCVSYHKSRLLKHEAALQVLSLAHVPSCISDSYHESKQHEVIARSQADAITLLLDFLTSKPVLTHFPPFLFWTSYLYQVPSLRYFVMVTGNGPGHEKYAYMRKLKKTW